MKKSRFARKENYWERSSIRKKIFYDIFWQEKIFGTDATL